MTDLATSPETNFAILAEAGRRFLELDTEQRAYYVHGMSKDQLDALGQAVAAAELQGADWRQDPATMMAYLGRQRYRLWAYTQLLGEQFRQAVEGEDIRQIWNLPRRYGKSLLASQWGPAWALDRHPWMNLLLCSYGDKLALENAIAVRTILRNHRNVMRASLRRDRQQASRFVTTEGGGVLAAGIHSGIVGFGAHGAVFDDPFKNWEEAHSATTRDSVDNAYRSVVVGALETERAFTIVPMTRWHENDLAERLLERAEADTGVRWTLIRLPELAEQPNPDDPKPWMRLPDPLGRQPGEPIEPERFSVPAIKMKHKEVGNYLAAAMFQQRPAPEEGSEIKRAWFRLDDPADFPDRYDDEIASWDMKLKDKETGSYVVGQYWGRGGIEFYLLDQLRGQWNQATTECAIALLKVRHPGIRRNYIENTGNGPEVMAALRAAHDGYEVSDEIADVLGMTDEERDAVNTVRRQGMGPLLPVVVKGQKTVRIRAVSGYIEGGHEHLPQDAPWVPLYLEEMTAFPNGAHDDQVDATSQALAKLIRGKATIRAPRGTTPKTQVNTRDSPAIAPARGRISAPSRIVIPRVTRTR